MKSLVLLAGCGLGDGSCIEEAILTYLALEKYNCPYQIVAVDMQAASINHITENTEGDRNVLVESARIGRGMIQNLNSVHAEDFDCLIIPGGIGLLNNYGNNSAVRDLVMYFSEHNKPIATMCAGIDFLRRLMGNEVLRKEYETLTPTSYCCDTKRNLFYTPAFRMTRSLCDVQKGIDYMIENLVLISNKEQINGYPFSEYSNSKCASI